MIILGGACYVNGGHPVTALQTRFNAMVVSLKCSRNGNVLLSHHTFLQSIPQYYYYVMQYIKETLKSIKLVTLLTMQLNCSINNYNRFWNAYQGVISTAKQFNFYINFSYKNVFILSTSPSPYPLSSSVLCSDPSRSAYRFSFLCCN